MSILVVTVVAALAIGAAWVLAYRNAGLVLWTVVAGAFLAFLTVAFRPAGLGLTAAWGVFLLLAVVLNLRPLRRVLVSAPLLRLFRRIMPSMSDTEREALEAGTVWWEAELFSGRPDWKKLLELPAPCLSPAEQAFLDGPVEEICRMVDDWQVTQELEDLSPAVWTFLRDRRFFGMIIPKRYGGQEFSALAHSAVVMKIASRSVAAAVTVMVPNSLGPAELLLHYGTEEQKNFYLPRLARGEEIPCFALTSAEGGSDAAAMPDFGVVGRGPFEGREVLGIRLTWEKRYITLAPVATLLGLAFKLYDPERLLGGEQDRGITLALIPTRTPGVEIGRRHNPLNIPFQNGPTSGREVFIPLDWVIGGREHVGQGWRMLMECLAAGRAISLPALSTGSGKLAARATGAYARLRRQFHLPIGKFEGVEEALARIGAYGYMMDGARRFTAQAVDLGEKPSVASAIVKYHLTEHMRRVVNDALDVQGGSAICLGPRNFLGRAYQALPISITVEGANILTRSLIIYGQGAVRCHPYVRKEMQALADADRARALSTFDAALFGHIGFTLSNAARALFLGLTGARAVPVPVDGPARCYARQITRLSAAFAFASDVAMLVLGGALKRREKLSGRLADALSYLYLASATLKHFEDQGRPPADRPLLDWALRDLLFRTEQALAGLIQNFPGAPARLLLRALIFPLGRRSRPPSDRLGQSVAELLLEPSAARERLTAGIFVPCAPGEALATLEQAFAKVVAADAVERKLRGLGRELGTPKQRDPSEAIIALGIKHGVINDAEAVVLREVAALRREVIRVDDFPAGPFHP